ncbi:unnamed protein product, partial [Adineta ricciae]
MFNKYKKSIIFFVLSTLLIASSWYTLTNNRQFTASKTLVSPTTTSPSIEKQSRWKKNQLVVIPAIWKEIDWANRSSWPAWLQKGLES